MTMGSEQHLRRVYQARKERRVPAYVGNDLAALASWSFQRYADSRQRAYGRQ
jgi:hypothetical protein